MFAVYVDAAISLATPTDRHARAVAALLNAERDRFGRWLPELAHTEDEQVRKHEQRRHAIAAGTCYSLIVEVGVVVAGIIGMDRGTPTARTAELGYLLASAYEGHGIVTRSLTTLISVAITDLAIHRFEIRCDPANQRSRAIPRRLGFRREGTLREALWHGGTYQDQEMYGLLASEWTPTERDRAQRAEHGRCLRWLR